MKQKEIWLANLNPTKGSEQQGLRPVVIISGNVLNTYLDIVIALPLSTKIKNYKGNLILKPSHQNGLEQPSEIITFQIRSLAKSQLTKKLGTISEEQLTHLKTSLIEILTY